MAVYVLVSAAGSPGVTTTTVAAAMQFPDSTLLIDADWQSAIQTGYLRDHTQVGESGVLRALQAIHNGVDAPQALWNETRPLPGDQPNAVRRLFLAGPATPPAAAALAQDWTTLVDGFESIAAAGIDVLIDAGRLGPAGLPPGLGTIAHEVLLVVHPTIRSTAAARWAVQRLKSSQTGSKARLVTIDTLPTITHYHPNEVARALNLEVRARIPHAPSDAAIWSDGLHAPARYRKSRYRAAIDHLIFALIGDRQQQSTAADTVAATAAQTFVGARQ